MFAELNDQQYASPVLMNRMVSAGLLGEKSGQGFYAYPKNSKKNMTKQGIEE
jgi:3-hydroxybutyryl-CoA dehydrogenase